MALDPSATRASGGAELQVALLARGLVERGPRVILLGADTGQPDAAEWHGVSIRKAGHYDTGAAADTIRALPKVFAALRVEQPDFVVVYGWTAWLWILAWFRRALGFRLVYVCALDSEINGSFRRANPIRGFLLEQGMRSADFRFGITEHHAALFRAKGMACAVTRLLLQAGAARETTEKQVDFLWVGRCAPVKHPHRFLDLAERLPGGRFRMICSPQDRELWKGVRNRAARLPNVEFVEGVPYRDIQSHFNRARAHVNTSDDEGMPNTFLHAGLGDCAILSFKVDPDEMLSRHAAGFCAGGEFETMQDRALEWLNNPDALREAAQGAAAFVRRFHDNATNINAFLQPLERGPES